LTLSRVHAGVNAGLHHAVDGALEAAADVDHPLLEGLQILRVLLCREALADFLVVTVEAWRRTNLLTGGCSARPRDLGGGCFTREGLNTLLGVARDGDGEGWPAESRCWSGTVTRFSAPTGLQWRGQVETSVEEDRWDVRQPGGPAQEFLLLEPGCVGEVVGADTDERDPILWWAVAVGAGSSCRFVGDERVFRWLPRTR
jgi:hypothetical protein